MGLRSIFQVDDAATTVPNGAEIVARYKRLRAVGQRLNNKLIERISKDVMDAGAKRLGILKKGVLVFNTEDEFAVLADYCIYDVRTNGRNVLEQYLIDSPPDPGSDEAISLQAMQRAVYSVYEVEAVHRGVGVTVRDLLSSQSLLVVDMGLGSTGKPGFVLATRLLFQEGFAMTSGAPLLVGAMPKNLRPTFTNMLSQEMKVDRIGVVDPAPIIKACLSVGSSSEVEYQELPGEAVRPSAATVTSRTQKVGRNTPCPCGSGKKFKHCCLKRS